MAKFKINYLRPNVVGVIHDKAGEKAAIKEKRSVDILEVRADNHIPTDWAGLSCKPIILTVRDAEEGGANKRLSPEKREAIYLDFLENAAAVDVEIRNAAQFRNLIVEAHCVKRSVIFSYHDFQSVPTIKLLRELTKRSQGEGAMCLKIAAMTNSLAELTQLLNCVEILLDAGQPFALMGMGRFAATSRVLFAQCGSCLNYGWLGSPQVAGQPSAKFLRELLLKLL